ncbi:VWA domain-containing protein [Pelotomaculum terephthalicicum JT]|uniref:vWA domain-containing protein n=1 Tax=Pelotomaculum TaxID=191373 RepID=UPI0009CB0D10|nr:MULTISPECIES: VWA domain-containing protein [Pelotomaculum]MCG9966504.1 VWA domain-containing protein [Pelotomaculum terephthalicicum JT]OPX86002.1 MAG: VWA domain containing CoxE-like protein [Pelotomaculum sp. PtaB.Bin117]OPY60688.1 MAG: VWA domain containing CoxE-like protein [Pelotomaculum sp. PtaU1.Bin065]
MFVNFFYELKRAGVPVSLTEWITLMEALSKGLAFSSLRGFYYLARAVLVKSEVHFDNYDMAFQNYFQGVETAEKVLEQALGWLEEEQPPLLISLEEEEKELFRDWDVKKLRQTLDEKLKTQDEKRLGGSSLAGTGGGSRLGHSGFNPKGGVRLGGASGGSSAVKVAGGRHYRGYRSDVIIGVRQFEAALRILSQLTTRHEGLKSELDLNGTVNATCRNAGRLKLVWDRPRKNKMKVVLLMDSGGSMDPYIDLCSKLFSAVKRSTHLKDLKVYYFHNCVYQDIYLRPACVWSNAVKTYDVLLHNLDPDYRLIIVGDASMAPGELTMANGAIDWESVNNESGLVWLERLVRHFKHAVWLNPIPAQGWDERMNYRAHTINMVRELFPMFELSLSGLQQAVKRLKVCV